jgi:hypothetical protein
MSVPLHLVRPLALLVPALLFAGCASPKFATVAQPGPAVPLNLAASSGGLRTSVESVVVPKGPGTWKQEAFWDEYQLALTNLERVPVTVLSIRLLNAQGDALDPGENCWHLEADSRAALAGPAVAQNIGLGIRAATTTVGRAVAPVGALSGVLLLHGVPLSPVGVSTLIVPAVTEKMNRRGLAAEGDVADEFDRRRIHLPVTLRPGATVRRSAFFPPAPSPRRLVVTCQVGEEHRVIEIDLAPLAGFHANGGRNLEPVPAPLAPLVRPPDP